MTKVGTEETVDLICVGAGLGGLAAALRADELGLSVRVLEASPLVGGVAAYSGGIVWVPANHLAAAAGLDDDLEAGARYLAHVGGPELDHDRALRASFVEHAHQAVQFLADHCHVDFRLTGLPDQYNGHVDSASAGARTLEALAAGAELGPWLAALRDGPFQPPHLSVRDVVASHSVTEAHARVGDDEMARRREQVLLTRGRGLVGALLADAIRRGVDIRLRAPATQLLVEGDVVVGVDHQCEGGTRRVRARRGVVIATGSYGHAPWRTRMEGLPEVFDQGPPITHGDGVTLTDPTPAALVRAGNGFTVLGYASRTRTHAGTDLPLHVPLYDSLGFPHSMVVNEAGERFGDESVYTTFTSAINRYDASRKAFSNHPAHLIVDDQFRQNGYVLGDYLEPWPEQAMVRAETLVGLAEKLGIRADGLESTVERFNADVAHGADRQFGRGSLSMARERHGDPAYPNPNLGSVRTPPFWGLRLSILAAGIYSHGLHLSPQAQVLDRKGHPVPGLYATGNAAAYVELPYGYENGFANARNLTYAYLAATHAAGTHDLPMHKVQGANP